MRINVYVHISTHFRHKCMHTHTQISTWHKITTVWIKRHIMYKAGKVPLESNYASKIKTNNNIIIILMMVMMMMLKSVTLVLCLFIYSLCRQLSPSCMLTQQLSTMWIINSHMTQTAVNLTELKSSLLKLNATLTGMKRRQTLPK